jgi:hypothetical protein
MRADLQVVLESLQDLPTDELPRLLGELEEIRATAMMRLTAPRPKAEDKLLNIEQAAQELNVSKDYLYGNDLPFVRRIGRKRLYSSLGISRYKRQLDSKTARR